MSRTYKINHVFKGDGYNLTRHKPRSKYGDNGLGKFFKKKYSNTIRVRERDLLSEAKQDPDILDEKVFKSMKKRIMWDIY